MAEGARLESVYTATYRGFESLPHRQIVKTDLRVGFFASGDMATSDADTDGEKVKSIAGFEQSSLLR